MRAMTIHVLNNIRDAFFRFIKAHKFHAMFKQSPTQILTYQMLKRYNEDVQSLRAHKLNEVNAISELAHLVEYLRSFFIIQSFRGLDIAHIKQSYVELIYTKIEKIFVVYEDYMIENNDPTYDDVRMFTATLLLFFEHKMQYVYEINKVDASFILPNMHFDNGIISSVKLYYLLMDNMVLIPETCKDYLSTRLEMCYKGVMQKIL